MGAVCPGAPAIGRSVRAAVVRVLRWDVWAGSAARDPCALGCRDGRVANPDRGGGRRMTDDTTPRENGAEPSSTPAEDPMASAEEAAAREAAEITAHRRPARATQAASSDAADSGAGEENGRKREQARRAAANVVDVEALGAKAGVPAAAAVEDTRPDGGTITPVEASRPPSRFDVTGTGTERVEADTVAVSRGGVSQVVARSVNVRQGGIGRVDAEEVFVEQGGIGAVRGDRVSVELGGIGAVLAGEARVTQGAVGTVVARSAAVEQSVIRTLVAADVHVDRPTGVLFLLAARVSGDVRPVLDWRGALAFGAAAGLVLGIFRGARRASGRRSG